MGSSLRRAAERYGLSVLVISQKMSNSYAAVGVIREAWLPTRRDKDRTQESLAFYRNNDMLLADNIAMTTSAKNLIPKEKADFFAVNINKALLYPDIEARVVSIKEDCIWTDSSDCYKAKIGIVAALGPNTLDFVNSGNSHISYGATRIIDRGKLPTNLMIHQWKPYQLLTLTYSETYTRIGSSTSSKEENAFPNFVRMASESPEAYHLYGGKVLVGARLHSDHETYAEHWVSKRLCFLFGFGKMGFALAPSLAEEVITKLVNNYVAIL